MLTIIGSWLLALVLLVTIYMITTRHSRAERRISKSDYLSLSSIQDKEIRAALQRLAEDIPWTSVEKLHRVHNSWGVLIAKVHRNVYTDGEPLLIVWAHNINLKSFVAITKQLSDEYRAKKINLLNSQEKERLQAREMLGLSVSQEAGQLSLVEKQ